MVGNRSLSIGEERVRDSVSWQHLFTLPRGWGGVGGWLFGRQWQQFPTQAASGRPVGHPITYGANLGEGPGRAPSNGFGNRA